VSVHAHPDDEASKGAATMARYAAEGIRTVLVCCTGGEEGEILNPEADTPEVRSDLAGVRRAELEASVDAIGYHHLYLLGYRDSGMPGTEANARPDSFAAADLDEAIARLVRIVRAERPQVIVGYARDRVYAHPDHVRVHEISVGAFERAGDGAWYPDAGEPWQPSKLYYTAGFTRERIRALHEWYVARQEESPFEKWLERLEAEPDDATADQNDDEPDEAPVTTRVDVADHLDAARDALRAHRTQIPTDSFFFRVPPEAMREIHPWDEYILARSLVGPTVPDGGFEDDLFAGLRVPARP
jgi:mycothiol S-conjugate amidase